MEGSKQLKNQNNLQGFPKPKKVIAVNVRMRNPDGSVNYDADWETGYIRQ